jgi:Na+/proline symporter
MWAISITDFIQTTLIVVGLIWVAVLVSEKAGGVMPILESAPEGSFQFFPDANPISWMNYLGAWMIIGLGSIPSQDIYQRVMSAKSERVAIRSAYLAGGLYVTIGLLPLFIALGAKFLYPEIYLENKQLLLPEMVLRHGGMHVQILFFGALISAIMSTTSSGLLAPSAIISENLIRPYFGNKLKEKHFLWILRINIITVAVVAVVLAQWKTNIYELVAGASILMLVSLFVPLTAGLYWKKASEMGALMSIVFGMIAFLGFSSLDLPYYPHLPATLVSAVSMVVGSLIFPINKKTNATLSENKTP